MPVPLSDGDIILSLPKVTKVTVERTFNEETFLYEENVHVTAYTEVQTAYGTSYNHEVYTLDGDTATGVNLDLAPIDAHYALVYAAIQDGDDMHDPGALYSASPSTPPVVS
jgi:hypothetical protein